VAEIVPSALFQGVSMHLWVAFILCTSVIVYAGTKLSKYGDIIAEKTGLGRTWMGVVIMASITSLPELVTGISSVTYTRTPDIAAGDVLGSCVFNMLTLAVLDVIYRPLPVSSKAHRGNILSAAFGILLFSVVLVSLFLGHRTISIGWVGFDTLVYVVIYCLAMKMIYSYEKKQISAFVKDMAAQSKYESISTKSAVLNYSINAVLVVFAAIFLPKIGEGIAESTGLGQTFVGNVFIAISTSLPEVVVCIAAVRMDAVDLAIGNLFGSNIFNILILAVDDILFFEGPLLSFVSPNHIISAIFAIAMTTTAIIGLAYRAEKKAFFLAWDSVVIVLLYVTYLMLHYTIR
jgi:cation:H+ antiporter